MGHGLQQFLPFGRIIDLGEYDFSAEKLRDSVGIRLPKLGG